MSEAHEPSERQVLYSSPIITECSGESSITAQQAKDLLGWEKEKDYVQRTKEYRRSYYIGNVERSIRAEFRQRGLWRSINPFSERVMLWNVRGDHRPLSMPHVWEIVHGFLAKETRGVSVLGTHILVDPTGRVLNGVHLLVALVIAGKIWSWLPDPKSKEPTLECFVTMGAKDTTDEIVRRDNPEIW